MESFDFGRGKTHLIYKPITVCWEEDIKLMITKQTYPRVLRKSVVLRPRTTPKPTVDVESPRGRHPWGWSPEDYERLERITKSVKLTGFD